MQQEYKCPKCNSVITYGAPSCNNCGQRFTWKQQPQPPPRESVQTPQYQQQQPELLSQQDNRAGTSVNLVYQDDPQPWGSMPFPERMRARVPRDLASGVLIYPLIIIIMASGFILAVNIQEGKLFTGIFGAAAFIGVLSIAATNPTKYQIFNDRIRIVCGYVFRFDIHFRNIENVTADTFRNLWGLNFNFINSFYDDDIVRIARKRGAKIYITPYKRTLFLENLNKAMDDWIRSNPG